MPGTAVSARRELGRAGGQFRRVLRQRHRASNFVCSILPAAGKSARFDLPECSEEIWHGYLPDAKPGQLYGYRAHGPYEPRAGIGSIPTNCCSDPYARECMAIAVVGRAVRLPRRSPRGDLTFDRRDSARAMPKSVVVDDSFNWGDDRPPSVPWEKTVIYEAHLRGLTISNNSCRTGTRNLRRARTSDVIEHLQRLGITAIELLPVHAFMQDRFLMERPVTQLLGLLDVRVFRAGAGYLSNPGCAIR